MNLRYLLKIIPLLLTSLLAWGDESIFFTTDRPASSLIWAIERDAHGFIWVGTENGLSRYDGYHFTHYYHDAEDSTSLSDNDINALLTDKDGHLWVGTAHGLLQYDERTDRFHRIAFPDGRSPRIYSLVQSHTGQLLVGTAGYGLYTYDNGHLKRASKFYNPTDSSLFYTHLYEDSHGDLWQASHLPTFYRFSKRGGREVRTELISPVGPPVAFIEQKKQLLVVGMNGIAQYEGKTNQLHSAPFDLGPLAGNATILSATTGKNGEIYLGTSEAGVWCKQPNEQAFKPVEGNHRAIDLRKAHVKALLSDQDENLWIGCYQKGLLMQNHYTPSFQSWSLADQDYITGSGVTSLTTGEGSAILWCTVENSGVFGFSGDGRVIAHPSAPAGAMNIYRDTSGHYWLATPSALYAYNPQTGTAQQKLTFQSAGVPCMIHDGKGNLYISVYSKGITRYNTTTGETRVFNMTQQSPHGHLCNDWVRDMLIDRHGLLWIATSNGVSCYDPAADTFDSQGWRVLLKEHMVNALSTDREDNIIIGTVQGLYRYDRSQHKATILNAPEMNPAPQVKTLVSDHGGTLWIATTTALYAYDGQKMVVHSPIRGPQAREYMQHAATVTSTGTVALGTPDGIIAFNPKAVTARTHRPGKVWLSSIVVDGRSIGSMGDSYELAHDQNTFALDLTTFDYQKASAIAFRYRVGDGRWQQTPEGISTINFNKLSPGTYDIEVQAVLHGATSEQSTIITIVVSHPWWSSTFAYIIYALLLAALVVYLMNSWARRRKADLDEQKMQFLINATHDIRSPLTLIMAPLKKLRARAQDVDSMRDLDTIDRNAQRLMLLVNQILDERKIDKGQMRLQCEETDLVAFAATIMHLFDYQANDRSISLTINSSAPKVMVWIDHINFDKVVSNLLSNAMKFTADGGKIEISVNQTKTHAVLTVTDNGVGLGDTDPSLLFERFYQGHSSQKQVGTGIGLNLARNIILLHGGTIKAAARPDGGHGSSFIVTLPLGKVHLADNQIKPTATDGLAESTIAKTAPSNNIRVMVVDDDSEIRRYITHELSTYYRFTTATNGHEALQQLLTSDDLPDVVVSDVMMPQIDGIQLLKRIKENPRIAHLPVVLLTSKSEVSNRLESIRQGADAFLAKPFNMEELHLVIDNLVAATRRMKGKFSGTMQQQTLVEDVEVKGNDEILMERIMRVVNSHIADSDFSVEQLAEEVGISRTQLHRKMKEITGISTGTFIRNLRLEQAAKLIAGNKINISQVTYAVGFSNQTHFSTSFKKHFGMTPTEYAEKHADND